MKKIILFFLVFWSCSEKEIYIEPEFASSSKITSASILEEKTGNMYLIKNDSYLIISNRLNVNEKLLSVFDLEHNFLTNLGEIGNKKNEFSELITVHDLYKGSAFIIDHKLLRILEIDIKKSIQDDSLVIYKEILLPRELASMQTAFMSNDNFLVGVLDRRIFDSSYQNKNAFKYDINSNELKVFDLISFETDSENEFIEMNVDARVINISEDRTKLIIASVNSPLVEIFDIENEYIQVHNHSEIFSKFTFREDIFTKGKYRQYNMFVEGVDEGYYMLYSGEETQKFIYSTSLQFFDWNGNGIKEFILEGDLAINVFSINEEKKKAIAMSYLNDKIYEFKLDL